MDFFGLPFGKVVIEAMAATVGIVTTVVGFLVKKGRDHKQQLDELKAEQAEKIREHRKRLECLHEQQHELERQLNVEAKELSNQVAHIRAELKYLPNKEQISHIHDRLNLLAKTTNQMKGSLDATGKQLALMNQHLLSKGEK